MSSHDPLKQAILAAKAGDELRAQSLLAEILSANPNHEGAWLWLARCVQDEQKIRYCLKKALDINPDNPQARLALNRMAALPHGGGRGKQTSRGKAPRFTAKQYGTLLCLAGVILAAITGMGFMLVQENVSPPPPGLQVPPSQVALENPGATIAEFQLPPTWTATSTATPTAKALHPTNTPFNTPTPLVTPPTALNQQWRFVIGYSAQNRPIEVYQFGAGPKGRMIIAGIHGGNEWNTIALADKLIAHLGNHPGLVPPGGALYILRSLNPDGEARSHSPDGRTNENGVDLNRNWDADWKANWSREGCWRLRPTTAGPYPGSEPETQALMQFFLSHRVEVLINYHSAGLGIFPSGDPPDPASVRLAQAIAVISNYPYPPIDTGCEFSGTLVDWALKQGITGVDLELSNHSDTDFETNLKILSLLLTWKP